MEVVKNGIHIVEHTCDDCGCTFKYNDRKDIIRKDFDGGIFGVNQYAHSTYVECPECDSRHYLTCILNGQNITDEMNE